MKIVTCVEEKFGLRNMEVEDILIQLMLMPPTILRKGRGHRVHEMVVSSAVEASVHDSPRRGNGKKCEQRKSWTKSVGQKKE